MTGHKKSHGADLVFFGLTSRQTRRRDAAKAIVHLISQLISHGVAMVLNCLRMLFWRQVNDWAILSLAAVLGAGLVFGSAVIVLLETSDLVALRNLGLAMTPML